MIYNMIYTPSCNPYKQNVFPTIVKSVSGGTDWLRCLLRPRTNSCDDYPKTVIEMY